MAIAVVVWIASALVVRMAVALGVRIAVARITTAVVFVVVASVVFVVVVAFLNGRLVMCVGAVVAATMSVVVKEAALVFVCFCGFCQTAPVLVESMVSVEMEASR